ncbi:hypothetical protein RI129_009213 [Pyrocoelia pectoralis]|uniref:DNA-directed RNA polymerase I subunit RPA43 n=1 Tax=Pyrocoelia pectoralis TaxID=417401 RepID=A0AAN7VCJ1_9COLE
MSKYQHIISFEKEYLNNLVSNKDSSVTLQEHEYHLALHPYHLNNLKQSIKDLLGRNIARYDRKLEGILLGFENIKLLSQGTIVDDSCFIHIDVSAKFFVFKPEVGQILVGFVSKKSKDHVGCLLYNTFNVSLPKPESEDVDSWLGTLTEIGNEIKFKIIFLKLQARLPYIRGEIVCEEESTKKSKKKKRTLEGEDEETPTKLQKKKKKKKKSLDVDEESLPNGFVPHKRQKETEREDSTEKVVRKSKIRKSESGDDLLEEIPKKKKRRRDEIEEESPNKFKMRNNSELHEFDETSMIRLKQERVDGNDVAELDVDSTIDNLISNEISKRSHKKKRKEKDDTFERVYKTEDLDETVEENIVKFKKRKKKHVN